MRARQKQAERPADHWGEGEGGGLHNKQKEKTETGKKARNVGTGAKINKKREEQWRVGTHWTETTGRNPEEREKQTEENDDEWTKQTIQTRTTGRRNPTKKRGQEGRTFPSKSTTSSIHGSFFWGRAAEGHANNCLKYIYHHERNATTNG